MPKARAPSRKERSVKARIILKKDVEPKLAEKQKWYPAEDVAKPLSRKFTPVRGAGAAWAPQARAGSGAPDAWTRFCAAASARRLCVRAVRASSRPPRASLAPRARRGRQSCARG